MSLAMSLEALGKNDLPWHDHRHWQHWGVSLLQTQTCHPHHPLTVIFILIIFFLSVIIIIASASSHGFATMGMAAHSLCIGGEVVQAVGTNKAKVVVHGSQVIHHHSLILTLFATPGAEGQVASSLQGLSGMDAIEAHDLWRLHGWDNLEKVDVLWGSRCHPVSSPEVLLAHPGCMTPPVQSWLGGSSGRPV